MPSKWKWKWKRFAWIKLMLMLEMNLWSCQEFHLPRPAVCLCVCLLVRGQHIRLPVRHATLPAHPHWEWVAKGLIMWAEAARTLQVMPRIWHTNQFQSQTSYKTSPLHTHIYIYIHTYIHTFKHVHTKTPVAAIASHVCRCRDSACFC